MLSRKSSSLIYTSLAHFTNDGNFLLFPMIIRYYQEFNANFTILAAGAIIYDLISGLLSPVIGRLADRTGSHAKLIFSGLAIEGLSVGIFGSAFLYPGFVNYIVVIGTVILGFGQSFYHPLGGTVLSVSYHGESYGKVLGINGSMGSVGRAMVILIVGLMIPLAGPAMSFIYVGIYEVIAGLIILNGLKWFRDEVGSREHTEDEETKQKVATKKYRGIIYTLAIVVFVRSVFSSGVVTFLPYYIGVIFNLPPLSSLPSEIISIAFIAPIFGQPLFGLITAKLGGKMAISLSSVLAVLFIVLFMLTHSLYIMTASLAGFAFAVFSGFPVLIGYVSQLVPREILTGSSGLVWGMGSTVGGALGIIIFDVTYDLAKLSISLSMWILIIVGVISIFMIPLLPSKNRSVSTATGSG